MLSNSVGNKKKKKARARYQILTREEDSVASFISVVFKHDVEIPPKANCWHKALVEDTVWWPRSGCRWPAAAARGWSTERWAGGGIHAPRSEEDRQWQTVTDRMRAGSDRTEAAEEEQEGGQISQKHILPVVIHSMPLFKLTFTCCSWDLILTPVRRNDPLKGLPNSTHWTNGSNFKESIAAFYHEKLCFNSLIQLTLSIFKSRWNKHLARSAVANLGCELALYNKNGLISFFFFLVP